MRIRLHGSLGDEVALTALPREIHRWHPRERIEIECNRPWLFDGNPHVGDGDREDLGAFDLPLAPEPASACFPFAYGERLGIRVIDPTPELVIDPIDQRAMAALAVAQFGPLVAIDPWAGWPRRRWRSERFLDVARRLEDRGYCVIEVGSTVADCTGALRPARMLGGVGVSFVDDLSLGQVAALLRCCRVLIANDSGLAHVAAAVGTPAVVPYAVPWHLRAYPSTRPVRPGASAQCYVTTEHCEHESECLDPVTVDDVEKAALWALGQ